MKSNLLENFYKWSGLKMNKRKRVADLKHRIKMKKMKEKEAINKMAAVKVPSTLPQAEPSKKTPRKKTKVTE